MACHGHTLHQQRGHFFVRDVPFCCALLRGFKNNPAPERATGGSALELGAGGGGIAGAGGAQLGQTQGWGKRQRPGVMAGVKQRVQVGNSNKGLHWVAAEEMRAVV